MHEHASRTRRSPTLRHATALASHGLSRARSSSALHADSSSCRRGGSYDVLSLSESRSVGAIGGRVLYVRKVTVTCTFSRTAAPEFGRVVAPSRRHSRSAVAGGGTAAGLARFVVEDITSPTGVLVA